MRKFWKERHIVIVEQHICMKENLNYWLIELNLASFSMQRRQKIKSYKYQRHDVCIGVVYMLVLVMLYSWEEFSKKRVAIIILCRMIDNYIIEIGRFSQYFNELTAHIIHSSQYINIVIEGKVCEKVLLIIYYLVDWILKKDIQFIYIYLKNKHSFFLFFFFVHCFAVGTEQLNTI